MAKWSPENALAIKKEVARLQDERASVVVEIDRHKRVLASLKKEIDAERVSLETIRASRGTILETFAAKKEEAEGLVRELQENTRILEEKRKALLSFVSVENAELHAIMTEKIPNASRTRESILAEIGVLTASLKRERGQMRKEISSRMQDKENLAREIEHLSERQEEVSSEIEEKIKERDDILSKVDEYNQKIREIILRERDVAIRERRMTPEYRAIYKEVNG